MDFINRIDQPDLEQQYPDKYFAACEGCGTVIRLPLEIKPPARVQEYGIDYYNQMARSGTEEASVRSHIQTHQVPHYQQLHAVLSALPGIGAYRRWLDVGSAGCPTAFADFDFTTVEPCPLTVSIGRELFRPDRIHCGVIETFDTASLFDGVAFMDSFYCVPSPNEALAAARRLLRADGLVLIRIGYFFMETKSVAADGQYHRIEDVFRGDTVWVYYNHLSLKHLCARHGFAVVDDFVLPQPNHAHKTCRYLIFRKQPEAVPGPTPADALVLQQQLLDKLQAEFRQITHETLAAVDHPNVALVGTDQIIRGLWLIRPLGRVTHCVDLHNPDCEQGYRLGGVPYRPLAELVGAVSRGEIRHVVVATFRHAESAVDLMRRVLPPGRCQLHRPSRQSGLESLFLDEGRDQNLSKAFALTAVS